MNNFMFENSTKVRFGKGAVNEYLAESVSHFGEHIMLAYGNGSIKKTGIYDAVKNILIQAGKSVVDFSGISPNPTYQKVLEGVDFVEKNKIDLILAVGGGSVIDCAKAISLAARCKGNAWENFWEKPGVVDFEPIPVGAIVTITGTGSEMNGGAVITNESKGIKTGRDYPKCNPVFALLDPTYTFTVSPLQTASGGFDILSHIMETYFSNPDESNVSDDISEALMKNVIENLPVAVENPTDYTARSNLMWASTMAENRIIKLGKRCDFEAHQIEHQLGAFTNCNHGQGLAVIHPVYYRHIYQYGLNKFVRFAKNVWSIPGDGKTDDELAQAGIQALSDFIKSIKLPTTLRELGIKQEELEPIAYSCNLSNGSYKPMTHEEILQILNECF